MPKGYVARGFEWLRQRYGVPARMGAPVEYEGKPGKVVGYADGHLLLKLDGERRTISNHPRWHMIWKEEFGPATALPSMPTPAPALMIGSTDGEPQWSGT